ncbi:MAG TPA: DUF6353 family protein, partial [Scandinavium sp.]|uniref:DUF6353 family protein n=1 Tax=Scandinavium sp. TaxID=2830653 RepID=UPI002E33ABC0
MRFVPEVISKGIAHRSLILEKNSPSLLFGAGIVGVVGSTVLACRATLKMQDVLDDTKSDLEKAKNLVHDDYSENDRQRDIAIIHVQAGMKIIRLYGPSIVVGGASIAALTRSHNILNERYAAVTAAYAALDKGFKEYRARVVDKYGEDQDREFRHGSREVEIIDEQGKKQLVTRVGDDGPSVYARFFDPLSTSWSKEPEYNLLFLKCQQTYANDLLLARGHVFLNEVYDMIGVPRSKAGSVVGWIITPGNRTDNHIDFGIYNVEDDKIRDFVNGREG